ncbi:hypothetical protein MKX03_008985 [Papaver bracteatum]|nr:hypothetical protein MKX03_008985 [Papaver bracteatum]
MEFEEEGLLLYKFMKRSSSTVLLAPVTSLKYYLCSIRHDDSLHLYAGNMNRRLGLDI